MLGPSHTIDCDTKSCPCKDIVIGVSIFTAAQTNDIKSIRRRISKNKDAVNKTDAYGYTPLFIAAQSDHQEIVKLLLDNGAWVNGSVPDINSCGCTPLHRAAYSGALESCRLLIENGASLDELDQSFG